MNPNPERLSKYMSLKFMSDNFKTIVGVVLGIISGVATATWAVAGQKAAYESSNQRIEASILELKKEVTSVAAAAVKTAEESAAKQNMKNLETDRRITDLENNSKAIQQLSLELKGVTTDIKYLTENVRDLRVEIRSARPTN